MNEDEENKNMRVASIVHSDAVVGKRQVRGSDPRDLLRTGLFSEKDLETEGRTHLTEIDEASREIKTSHMRALDTSIKRMQISLMESKEYIGEDFAANKRTFDHVQKMISELVDKIEERKIALEEQMFALSSSSL